jgi:hypothetical protein
MLAGFMSRWMMPREWIASSARAICAVMRSDLAGATVVTLFLSYDFNLVLQPKLERELVPGTRLVSHWHRMGDWPLEGTVHIRGADRGNDVFLYRTRGPG